MFLFIFSMEVASASPGPINDTMTGPCRDVMNGVGNADMGNAGIFASIQYQSISNFLKILISISIFSIDDKI